MKNLFKIHIIKNFIIALTITLTLAIISTSNANANMFNRFKKGFYFEKYSTAEEAKAALLELHPIGSDVGDLIKTLERAGANVSEEDLKEYHNYKEYDYWWKNGVVKIYRFKYDRASYFFVILNQIEWTGVIQLSHSDDILNLGINKGRAF
jgi:hypothetical protein